MPNFLFRQMIKFDAQSESDLTYLVLDFQCTVKIDPIYCIF